MTGIFKWTNDKFIVEYVDLGIYVQWQPGETANAEKPTRRIKGALPRQEQVPVSMLRSLIGSEARFSDTPRFEERKVELRGSLTTADRLRSCISKESLLRSCRSPIARMRLKSFSSGRIRIFVRIFGRARPGIVKRAARSPLSAASSGREATRPSAYVYEVAGAFASFCRLIMFANHASSFPISAKRSACETVSGFNVSADACSSSES
jgi:hypothetical protein